MKNKKSKIIDKLRLEGFFSEYLPDEFSTADFVKLKNIQMESTDIKPCSYTMNKNDTSFERRTISIPEIGSYINAIKYLESTSIIEEIISLTNNNDHSLSKIFNDKNDIISFKNPYSTSLLIPLKNDDNDDFISNTIIKLKRSFGSKGILRLDIANFYGGFYTHNIASIGNGSMWAEEKYQEAKENEDPEYKSLKGLDTKIRDLNQKRTHGLLIGPLISFIIAEGLMATIDKELAKEFKDTINIQVDFIRYMDDYDVYIKDEKYIPLIISTFTKVLEKYGFVLSDSKTKYIEFPFYVYEDFKELIDEKKQNTSKVLLSIYSKLSNYEIQKNQKGGLYFFSSNAYSLTNNLNYQEVISILLSTIKTSAKSIPISCNTLLKIYKDDKYKIKKEELFNVLFDYLNECIDKRYEWESVWLIYTLIKIDEESVNKTLFKILEKDLIQLVLIVVLNELTLTEDQKLLLKSKSTNETWLLNYELFRLDVITREELKAKTQNDKLFNNFSIMKTDSIKLYVKQ